MRIIEDVKLDFSDVLITPKRSTLASRADVSLERTYTFKHSEKTWTGVPIIAANMDHTGTYEMLEVFVKHKMLVALDKNLTMDRITPNTQFSYFKTIGIIEASQLDGQLIPEKLCIDVANGYTENFLDFVNFIRDIYPDTVIMAGNVVTAEMTEALILAGADIVKVGIGPGSVCTTRLITGVGYPQLSAVIECADAAHGVGGLVCSDGGCVYPGDVAKAFGAGADFVMLGGMLAGHKECAGDITGSHLKKEVMSKLAAIFEDFQKRPTSATHFVLKTPSGEEHIIDLSFDPYGADDHLTKDQAYDRIMDKLPADCFDIDADAKMKFYGMSSEAAMDKYSGGVAKHRAAEGKEVLVPYKGSVENTIQQILGGVRSACTYTGSLTLKELPKRCTFVRVNHQNNTSFNQYNVK